MTFSMINMNRVGKWFHIIHKINKKVEIKSFSTAERTDGVMKVHFQQNDQQFISLGVRKEGILLGCVLASQLNSDVGVKNVQGIRSLSTGIFKGTDLGHSLVSHKLCESRYSSTIHPCTLAVRQRHTLPREWLVELWLEEKKKNKLKHKRQWGGVRSASSADSVGQTDFSSFRLPFDVPSTSVNPGLETQAVGSEGLPLHQPPPSQSLGGILRPTCSEEVMIAPLLARANLLIARDVEWANLMFGFEQENRYAIVDPSYSQTPVGFIREQSNIFIRQLMRTRRHFIALITDSMGNELFRVRRPPWLINSTIYVEIDGKEIGVVHRRWHLWRRIYDLYLGTKQFAVVENAGFWDWTFTLKDENGKTLAEIDRDWRGFGFEMFTDAGQYVIRFGDIDSSTKTGLAAQIQELDVSRPLTLLERAVTVALAVSLDNDYFSRHSGWGVPIIPFWGGE